jgi:hypothetical protein
MYSYGKKYLLISVTRVPSPVHFYYFISSAKVWSQWTNVTLKWILLAVVRYYYYYYYYYCRCKRLCSWFWRHKSFTWQTLISSLCKRSCNTDLYKLLFSLIVSSEVYKNWATSLSHWTLCLQMWSSGTSYTSCSVQACSSIQKWFTFCVGVWEFFERLFSSSCQRIRTESHCKRKWTEPPF